MPYFGEQQQQPQQQQWGQPQQQQWGQPEQQQWGQPQQQQWVQPQQQQQQWQPQQQMAQGGPQVGGQQQSFSPVQQQPAMRPPDMPWAIQPAPSPAPQPVPEPTGFPIGPGGGGFPGIGGGPPGMPGISPELQSFLDGLSNRYQPQPGMGGGNPLIQMLLMMMMGGGGGGMPGGPGMPGPDFPKPGDGPDQGEPPKPKTRGVPDSWGPAPPVPDGDYPVSADIPGFGMFNGPVTIFNWIRQNIAEHGPMDEPGPEPGPDGGPQTDRGRHPMNESGAPGIDEELWRMFPNGRPEFGGPGQPGGDQQAGGFQDWLDSNPGWKERPEYGGVINEEIAEAEAGRNEKNPDGTPKGHMHIQAHPNIDHSKSHTSHSPPGWGGGK